MQFTRIILIIALMAIVHVGRLNQSNLKDSQKSFDTGKFKKPETSLEEKSLKESAFDDKPHSQGKSFFSSLLSGFLGCLFYAFVVLIIFFAIAGFLDSGM